MRRGLLLGEFRLLGLELRPLPLELGRGLVLLLLVQDLLVSALAVDSSAVLGHERGLALDHGGLGLLGGGGHQALRGQDLCVLDDRGLAVLVEEAHERLARAELQDDVLALEVGVRAERLGGGADGPLLGGGVGAQAVLHAVGELRQHLVGDVARGLGDEVHAHALGANELDDLDELVQQLGGHVVEEQMGLVKEEHEARLVEVSDLGELLKEVGEHPQQEHRVDLRLLDEARGV